MAELQGKVALVTGGGSGIGRAICLRLHQMGAKVAVLDHAVDSAGQTLESLGEDGIALEADVADEDAMRAAVATVSARFGGFDIAVNAAGVGLSARITEQSAAEIERVLRVNVTGVLLSCKAEANEMKRLGTPGVIVNIASTNARQPGEGLSAYCASKAGVALLTQVAAMELAPDGIRVVGVGPGLTETPMVARFLQGKVRETFVENIPLRRPGQPADIANMVGFVVSDRAAYLTGDTIYVEGGALTGRYPTLDERGQSAATETR